MYSLTLDTSEFWRTSLRISNNAIAARLTSRSNETASVVVVVATVVDAVVVVLVASSSPPLHGGRLQATVCVNLRREWQPPGSACTRTRPP